MCGIAGIADKRGVGVPETVQRMTETLARRGPDGEGLEGWDTAVLGHRRLAIFDLSAAGRQPMVSPDRAVGVVFNGAIYNFKEIRGELETRGYRFRSATDTEVLVHGYREWGMRELVGRIRGMFAFALWDDRDRRLFLVRDRLGVKPLVFTSSDSDIAFASTIRALRAAGRGGEIDREAMLDYLQHGFISDDHSIYRGILKVPAASVLEWHDASYKIWQYWSPFSFPSRTGIDFEVAVSETERLLLEAVSLRLQADVPVGVLLSSGIDSSLVCWAVAKMGADIRAFTVGVPGDPWDEAAGAVETARTIGIRHQVLRMADLDISSVDRLVDAYAEPFACASALGMLGVSAVVAGQATVLLTGDGGDDVFLGYPRHRHLWMAQRFGSALPESAAGPWSVLRRAIPRAGPLRRARAFGDYAIGGAEAFEASDETSGYYAASGILGERLRDRTDRNAARPAFGGHRGASVFDDTMENVLQRRFVGEYMTKVDGSTMYYALEARSPFLDQRLWEFAASLPVPIRLHHLRLKAILREIVRRRIGMATAARRKRGFGIPVHRWLADGWYEGARSVWADSVLHREGWIDAGAVERAFAVARKQKAAPQPLWYLYVLEMWRRHENSTRVRPLERTRPDAGVAVPSVAATSESPA